MAVLFLLTMIRQFQRCRRALSHIDKPGVEQQQHALSELDNTISKMSAIADLKGYVRYCPHDLNSMDVLEQDASVFAGLWRIERDQDPARGSSLCQ